MRDRSAVWIGTVDLCLAVLAVVIVAVNPKATPASDVQQQAKYLVTMAWNVADYDADMDLWVVTPTGVPVFFGNRQSGCVTLDQDNKGWYDSKVTLPDGSQSFIESAKEVVSIRCLVPGHYVAGVNLYNYHEHPGFHPNDGHLHMPVHVEIVDNQGTAKDVLDRSVTIDRNNQTINITGFDVDAQGHITLTDPPLEPVTDSRGKR